MCFMNCEKQYIVTRKYDYEGNGLDYYGKRYLIVIIAKFRQQVMGNDRYKDNEVWDIFLKN